MKQMLKIALLGIGLALVVATPASASAGASGVKTAPGLPGGATSQTNYAYNGALCTTVGNPNIPGDKANLSVSLYVED